MSKTENNNNLTISPKEQARAPTHLRRLETYVEELTDLAILLLIKSIIDRLEI